MYSKFYHRDGDNGKNYIWLQKQTDKFGIKPEEALIVTIDGEDKFFCQPLEKEDK